MPPVDARPNARLEPRLVLTLGLCFIALCALWGWWRQTLPEVRQQLVPVSQAQGWMLETLPGIGPKTAPQWLERLQSQGIDGLPHGVRPMAEQLFIDDRLSAQQSPDQQGSDQQIAAQITAP